MSLNFGQVQEAKVPLELWCWFSWLFTWKEERCDLIYWVLRIINHFMNQSACHKRCCFAVILVFNNNIMVITCVDKFLDIGTKYEYGSIFIENTAPFFCIVKFLCQFLKFLDFMYDHELYTTLVTLRCVQSWLLIVVALNKEESN